MNIKSAVVAALQLFSAVYFIVAGAYGYFEYGMNWLSAAALLIGYGFAVTFVIGLHDDMKFVSQNEVTRRKHSKVA